MQKQLSLISWWHYVVIIFSVAVGCAESADTPPNIREIPALQNIQDALSCKRDFSCKADLCGSCITVDLTASIRYKSSAKDKKHNHDDKNKKPKRLNDDHCTCRAIDFTIPDKIPVALGNAGNKEAEFSFHLKKDDDLTTCRYRGGSSKEHPTTPSEIAKGLNYLFVSCENHLKVGTKVSADFFKLEIDDADPKIETTQISLRIKEKDCSTCTPTTCSAQGADCGVLANGCGATLNCGSCTAPESCGGSGTPNYCGCTPTTCAAEGAQCGSISNGCGGIIECGSCTSPQNCGGGGIANQCGCSPLSCADAGATCGSIPNGCGGTLHCGSCEAPTTCGGGGTAHHCGCTPTTCEAAGAHCGSIPDGCGHTLDCGSCQAPFSCGGGGLATTCGCTPTSCAAANADCGAIADGCGASLNCGSCESPASCGGSGLPNQCGCTPTTCEAVGATCGTLSNGCGGSLNCGSCGGAESCGGSGLPNVCGCTPTTCAAAGANCGLITDGCGHDLNCGECLAPDSCGGAGVPHQCGTNLPPDPATVATPVPAGVATDFAAATEFLYRGANAIQKNVVPGTIVPRRAAVIRGHVFDVTGAAQPGVTLTINNHPDYGFTLSRADGAFDLAVNGGSTLVVNYALAGFMTAQRTVDVPWHDYVMADDVVLQRYDTHATFVDLNNNPDVLVARGSPSSDADGIRQATVFIPPQTESFLKMPDGSLEPVDFLTLRATEYTQGRNALKLMPAPLPPTSFYTYAVELSADEATTSGATSVEFSQPLGFYVENFLNFPVGTPIPVGYYDRELAAWIPAPDGVVLKIVSITHGEVDIDLNGDDAPESDSALEALGISPAERFRLASTYAVGSTLWRAGITHFTPWDLNMAALPPEGAGPPPGDSPKRDDGEPDDRKKCGSILGCFNQTLGESLPLAGTPFHLHYVSDRAQGRSSRRALQIALSQSSIHATLRRIDTEISVAGRRFTDSFAAVPNSNTPFQWDGRDAYGRLVNGAVPVTVKVTYAYPAIYMRPSPPATTVTTSPSFSLPGAVPAFPPGTALDFDSARAEFAFDRTLNSVLETWDGKNFGVAGWSLDVHHVYEPALKLLLLGNGDLRRVEALGVVLKTVGGSGINGPGTDTVPALNSALNNVRRIAVGPDGSIYFSEITRVRKIGADGIVRAVAGTSIDGFSGDNGPATLARLSFPSGIAIAADNSVYIVDTGNEVVRKVSPNGVIRTIAGIPSARGYTGDNTPATLTRLNNPTGIVLTPDGGFIIADTSNCRLRKVAANGSITTLAGTGATTSSTSGVCSEDPEGSLALETDIGSPDSLALGKDGSLYYSLAFNGGTLTPGRLMKVDRNGVVRKLADTSVTLKAPGFGVDENANCALISMRVALDSKDNLYFTCVGSQRIGMLPADGSAPQLVVGATGNFNNANPGFAGDNGPALLGRVARPLDIAIGADNTVVFLDANNARIRRIGASIGELGTNGFGFASSDGAQIFSFSQEGRHTKTLNSLTGATLYEFGYDTVGHLSSVTDSFGNVTTLERDSSSHITITAPFGERTEFDVNNDGLLATMVTPTFDLRSFDYVSGLLTDTTDARNFSWHFDYDGGGRLIADTAPDTGRQTFTRLELPQGYQVTHTTAEGRRTIYQLRQEATGVTKRTLQYPDTTVDTFERRPDGHEVSTYADGTTEDVAYGPDPRFGMAVPVVISRKRTTGGINSVITHSRTATLSNPADPFSLQTQSDTVVVNGRSYVTTYNAATHTQTVTTPEGRTSLTTLDDFGRSTGMQSGTLAPTSLSYEPRGRLQSVVSGSGASARSVNLDYDSDGYLARITDPLLQTVNFTNDKNGRVLIQTLQDSTTLVLGYDGENNVTSLQPPGRANHLFDYSPLGLLGSYLPPQPGTILPAETYAYDKDRLLTLLLRPDGTSQRFGYEPVNGRLTTLTDIQGVTTFGYNGVGQLATIASPNGETLTYTYQGSLMQRVSWSGPVVGSVSFDYDANFFLAGESVNSSRVALGRDRDGLLTSAGALALTRDAANGIVRSTVLGNVRTSENPNVFGELQRYSASIGSSLLYDLEVTSRDGLGRISDKSETVDGATTPYHYDYDSRGRLAQVFENGVLARSYAYDANGNRLSKTTSGSVTESGVYDAQDRVQSYGGANYVFNAAGDLQSKTTSGATTNYAYDGFGNLLHAQLPDGRAIDYTIDGENRRVGKRINGVPVQGFLYQDALEPVAELDGANNVVSRFVYATRLQVPDYMTKGGATYRFVTDQVGSVRLVVDATSGAIAQRLDYDEFGNVHLDSNPGFQPFGFTGGIYDRDTGLVRFGARDYEPKTGRWTAKDPIRFEGGDANLYVYAGGDAINFVDPSGQYSTVFTFSFFVPDFFQGLGDQWTTYRQMKDANVRSSDKYFHCVAHCRASRHGQGGRIASKLGGDLRESFDQGPPKFDSPAACEEDQAANDKGRNSDPNITCEQACGTLKPNGL